MVKYLYPNYYLLVTYDNQGVKTSITFWLLYVAAFVEIVLIYQTNSLEVKFVFRCQSQ